MLTNFTVVRQSCDVIKMLKFLVQHKMKMPAVMSLMKSMCLLVMQYEERGEVTKKYSESYKYSTLHLPCK